MPLSNSPRWKMLQEQRMRQMGGDWTKVSLLWNTLHNVKIEGGTIETVEGIVGITAVVIVVHPEGDVMMTTAADLEAHLENAMMIIVGEDVIVVHQETDTMTIAEDAVVPGAQSTGTEAAVNLQEGTEGVTKIIAEVIVGTTVGNQAVVAAMIEITEIIAGISEHVQRLILSVNWN